MVLDLGGNQGGYLAATVCVAGEFIKAGTPLFRLTSRAGDEVVRAPTDGRHPPIAIPLVVFMDQDTESGALLLAVSLRDAGRADLIGASKAHANDKVLALLTTQTGQDRFVVPVGHMQRMGGSALSAGVQVDVRAPPGNEDAMLEAARTRLGVH